MLYNNRGYTIEIPDELYWSMTDEEFNEYIDSKFVESFTFPDNGHITDSFSSVIIDSDNPED